jgi:hypothetical protein
MCGVFAVGGSTGHSVSDARHSIKGVVDPRHSSRMSRSSVKRKRAPVPIAGAVGAGCIAEKRSLEETGIADLRSWREQALTPGPGNGELPQLRGNRHVSLSAFIVRTSRHLQPRQADQ